MRICLPIVREKSFPFAFLRPNVCAGPPSHHGITRLRTVRAARFRPALSLVLVVGPAFADCCLIQLPISIRENRHDPPTLKAGIFFAAARRYAVRSATLR